MRSLDSAFSKVVAAPTRGGLARTRQDEGSELLPHLSEMQSNHVCVCIGRILPTPAIEAYTKEGTTRRRSLLVQPCSDRFADGATREASSLLRSEHQTPILT
jgi:hypothetical protein